MGQLEQITASAGSGKTYTLIRRFLELLAESGQEGDLTLRDLAAPSGRPHAWPEILAATFTNAAASEMKERLIRELKTYALGDRAHTASADANANTADDASASPADASSVGTINAAGSAAAPLAGSAGSPATSRRSAVSYASNTSSVGPIWRSRPRSSHSATSHSWRT